MANDFKRTDRIAEVLLRQLAQLVQQEITDPRLTGFVTLSAAKVSKDLSHAKIYFTVFNGCPKETAEALNAAAGYLRALLAKTSKLRTMPQLHFVYDESIEYGKRLSRLIDDINADDNDDEKA